MDLTPKFDTWHSRSGFSGLLLAALDDRDRERDDNPSIGLILCREHNRVVVEYALRHVDAPIGVARYRLLGADALPVGLMDALPTAEELEPGILPGCEADDE